MASNTLSLTVGIHSQAGVHKTQNQDFAAHVVPKKGLLLSKGAAFSVADGISSSDVGADASKNAVRGFLNDYMDTPESWSAKTSGLKVLKAINSWLVTQNLGGGRTFNQDKGMVCAFAALVLKSNTAHVFHSGDVRVLRVRDDELISLTRDHRSVAEGGKVYLSGGLGLSDSPHIDVDEHELKAGDVFLLLSDGVHERLNEETILNLIQNAAGFDEFAHNLCKQAADLGSLDDCTALVVKVCALPEASLQELSDYAPDLKPPVELKKGLVIDGLTLIRPLATTPRSHVWLVQDHTAKSWVLKVPSKEKQEDAHHVESMLMEEWVARRLQSPHLVKAPALGVFGGEARTALYTLSEFIEGQSLKQWMHENPRPSLMQVRQIVRQIAQGLQAMHRREVIHRDLRSENVLIDDQGTVTLIDFGAARVMGLSERPSEQTVPGSVQYAAPEFFLGSFGTARSDVFSLGVLTYQMLSGQLPFGLSVAQAHSQAQQLRLKVRPLGELGVQVPDWAEYSIYKALSVRPEERYAEVSEFMYELEHPSPDFVRKKRAPLLERDPVRFWQILSAALALLLALDLVWPFWG